jgi:hypothetical protein
VGVGGFGQADRLRERRDEDHAEAGPKRLYRRAGEECARRPDDDAGEEGADECEHRAVEAGRDVAPGDQAGECERGEQCRRQRDGPSQRELLAEAPEHGDGDGDDGPRHGAGDEPLYRRDDERGGEAGGGVRPGYAGEAGEQGDGGQRGAPPESVCGVHTTTDARTT